MKYNSVNITFKDCKPDPEYNAVMTLTGYAAALFKEHFEIEILNGEVIELENGMVEWRMNLSTEKADLFKQALMKSVFGDPNKRQS